MNAIDDGLETGLGTGLGLERLRFSGLFTTGDQRGDAQFRREWPWEGHLHGALTPAGRLPPRPTRPARRRAQGAAEPMQPITTRACPA
jgi:hypothetical protein